MKEEMIEIVNRIKKFIDEEKFNTSEKFFYLGLSKPELKGIMTSYINQSAVDFINVIESDENKEKFFEEIEKGLKRVDVYKFDLDTNDKEMVCTYYQILMDIVGLESSNGLLNSWLYGFDPNGVGML